MKRKKTVISLVLMLSLTLLSGCKSNPSQTSYKDGTYHAASSPDDNGAYGEVTITVKNGKITDCEYVTWQKDGTKKDENYGKVNGEISNQDFYTKAQTAVNAMDQYAKEFVEVQKLEDVDAVSGATISFDQFHEAVTNALSSKPDSN